jgi:uncharacterized membrane protein
MLTHPLSGLHARSIIRSEIDRLLTLSVLFSIGMAVIRVMHTGKSNFLFMIWNLFLAYIPYALTKWLSTRESLSRKIPVFIPLFLTWLFFIPNTFYIITDLFHLGDHYNDRLMPQWFDLAMILSFVWNGFLLGVLSVRQMEKILQPLLPAHNELFFLYPIMWLNALGVFTGRYLRYNSWDVLTNPFQLLIDIGDMLIHPLRYRGDWYMIFCYSILMTLMYLMLKKISKVFAQ